MSSETIVVISFIVISIVAIIYLGWRSRQQG